MLSSCVQCTVIIIMQMVKQSPILVFYCMEILYLLLPLGGGMNIGISFLAYLYCLIILAVFPVCLLAVWCLNSFSLFYLIECLQSLNQTNEWKQSNQQSNQQTGSHCMELVSWRLIRLMLAWFEFLEWNYLIQDIESNYWIPEWNQPTFNLQSPFHVTIIITNLSLAANYSLRYSFWEA